MCQPYIESSTALSDNNNNNNSNNNIIGHPLWLLNINFLSLKFVKFLPFLCINVTFISVYFYYS